MRAIRLVRQPDGSSLCGQACVAMILGTSLQKAIKAVGHQKKRGTTTKELAYAICLHGKHCADRAKRLSRKRPVWPKRALLTIHRPPIEGKRRAGWHWLLAWDGQIFDPEGRWPDYEGWKITSYVEIYE